MITQHPLVYNTRVHLVANPDEYGNNTINVAKLYVCDRLLRSDFDVKLTDWLTYYATKIGYDVSRPFSHDLVVDNDVPTRLTIV